jgi:lipopolysaccharide/colanic/teichoic acid biosynthesis glycosyltransferase
MELVTRLLPRPLSSVPASSPDAHGTERVPRAHSRSERLRAVDESLFRDILIREWRRAERFDQGFALVLVAGPADPSTPWSAVSDTVMTLKHETDVLGWFVRDRVLGVLRPDCDHTNLPAVHDFEKRVRRELDERLDPGAAASLSIGVHVPLSGSRSGASHGDPVFEELRDARGHLRVRAVAKRVLDIVGSLVLLLLLLPLLTFIALLVKLTSSGAVFFRQVRIGASGKPFTMLKFRTMRVDADHELHRKYVTEFINAGTVAAPADGDALFKIVDDPRVTFMGRLLRKTSLDELPQLWNVIRGDMSLVGPRPPLAYEVEQYKRWHYRRVLEAKPGITGLWQVTGRSRTSFDDMVRLDLRYVQNQSAWTDIKILLATPRAVISGKGAC